MPGPFILEKSLKFYPISKNPTRYGLAPASWRAAAALSSCFAMLCHIAVHKLADLGTPGCCQVLVAYVWVLQPESILISSFLVHACPS